MPVTLPFRKMINVYFLYFFGIPVLVYTHDYLKGIKAAASLNGILFYAVPTIACLLFFTPVFRFKSDDKETKTAPWLKIPVAELYVLVALGISSLITFGGLASFFDGAYKEGMQMIVPGLPVTIALLLALNSRKIWFREQLMTGIMKKELDAKRADIGVFSYTDSAFSYVTEKVNFDSDWNAITGIVAYKTDNFAYDTIHLVVKKQDGAELNINEDTPGWYIFKETMPDHLQGMDVLWELKVMKEAFALSPILVYEKGNDLMQDWGKGKAGK